MKLFGFKSDHKTYMKLNSRCGVSPPTTTECCPANSLLLLINYLSVKRALETYQIDAFGALQNPFLSYDW